MTTTLVETEQELRPQAEPARSRRHPIALIVAYLVAIAAAAAMYQPWVSTPFDIIDFSEFLPFLSPHDSIRERFAAFVGYFVSQGRFDLLSYLLIIWKWSFFGSNVVGWQIARFVEMCAIVVAVYVLLRRLGSERWGAAFGASLFIVAQTASQGWIRLTMGEPFGLLAIIGASLIATRYQTTTRWRSSAAGIAILLALSLSAKEMLIAFVPFVLLLAATSDGSGGWQRLRPTRRNVWLAVLVGVGAVAVLLPVAVVALRASAGAYASDYGTGAPSLSRLLHSIVVILFPASGPLGSRLSLVHLIANVLFLAITITGVALSPAGSELRRRWSSLGVCALVLVAVGALIYLPWPYFQSFYGLPFLLAPALLLALAITSIEEMRPSWRWAAYAACVAIFIQGASYAAHDSRSAIAARKINRVLVSDFAQQSTADSIVVAMRFLPSQSWQGLGPTLGRYAKVVLPDQHIPAISDALCPATLPMLRQGVGNAILVTYSSQCGAFPVPARTLRYYYTYLRWPTMAPTRDSLVVGILGPDGPK